MSRHVPAEPDRRRPNIAPTLSPVHRHVALRGRRPRDPPRQDQRPAPTGGCRHALARPTPARARPRALQERPPQGPEARQRLPQQEPAMRQDRRLRHRQGAGARGRPGGHQGGHPTLHVPRACRRFTVHVRLRRLGARVRRVRTRQRRQTRVRRGLSPAVDVQGDDVRLPARPVALFEAIRTRRRVDAGPGPSREADGGGAASPPVRAHPRRGVARGVARPEPERRGKPEGGVQRAGG